MIRKILKIGFFFFVVVNQLACSEISFEDFLYDYFQKVDINKEKQELVHAAFALQERTEDDFSLIGKPDKRVIIDIMTMEELNIGMGTEENEGLFAQIEKDTTTKIAKALLWKILNNPTTDIGCLKQKQDVMRVLESNEDLRNKLKKIFDNKLADGEGELLNIVSSKENNNIEDIKTNYKLPISHITDDLIPNEYAKSALFGRFKPITRIGFNYLFSTEFYRVGLLIPDGFAKSILNYIFNKDPKFFGSIFAFSDNSSAMGKLKKSLNFENVVRVFAPILSGYVVNNIVLKIFGSDPFDNNNTTNNILKLLQSKLPLVPTVPNLIGYSLCATALDLYESKQKYEKKEKQLHQVTIDVSTYLKKAEDIYFVIKQNPELEHAFPDFCQIFDSLTRDKDLNRMNERLKTDTFSGDPSFFSNMGRVVIAHDELIKNVEHKAFTRLMQEVAKIDLYLALCEWKKKQKHVCYPIYEQSENGEPHILLKNYIHHSLSDGVTNTWELGGNTNNVACVTGMKGGGKSAALKGLFSNGAFGPQTIALSLSDYCAQTPFGIIKIKANLRDEIGGLSRYQTEVKAVGDWLEDNEESAYRNILALLALDEPLSGTNPEAGTKGLRRILEEAVRKNKERRRVINIILTHYVDGINNPNVNQVSVSEQKESEFKLVHGKPSSYSTAETMLQEEFEKRKKRVAERFAKAKVAQEN